MFPEKFIDCLILIIFIISLNYVMCCYFFEKQNKKNEKFIVADAQDIHNYDNLREKVLEKDNFFNSQLTDPDKETIIKYNDNIKNILEPSRGRKELLDKHPYFRHSYDKYPYEKYSYNLNRLDKYFNNKYPYDKYNEYYNLIKEDDRNFSENYDLQFVSNKCENDSINDKYKRKKSNFVVYNPDDSNFKLSHYKRPNATFSTPMELTDIKGYNYMSYDSSIHPSRINKRILTINSKGLSDREKNIPNGQGYAFHDSPAFTS